MSTQPVASLSRHFVAPGAHVARADLAPAGQPRPTALRVWLSSRIVAGALVVALGAPAVARAEPRSAWAEGGIGLACVVTSLFYSTAKVLYAGAGAITGLAGYALTGGKRDVLETIINPSLRGDYVITPEHLRGQRRLVFIGPYPEDIADEESGVSGGGSSDQREPEPYPF